ncbi:MAG TPA: ABC transporter substrate-binding protein [Xanthobacteraceae bacterium]|nr:ABC transporter substrate-binding protein [Xanthobacteraceae bacterium]
MGIVGLGQRVLVAAALKIALASGPAFALVPIKFSLDSRFDGTSAIFLVGIDRGYYKAEGIALTIDSAADLTESIARVASGNYDMAFVDINALIRYRDQNPAVPVKAVYMVHSKPAYAVVGRKSREVNKPADLAGKKIGAPAADVAVTHWRLFAQVNKINTAEIKIENVGLPVREPLLQSGQVDAVIGYSYVIVPNLKSMGVPANDIVLMLMADHGLVLYGGAIVVNAKFAAEKPDAVRSFLQGFTRSLRETLRAPGPAVESVIKRNDALVRDVELERLRMVLRENIFVPDVRSFLNGAIDPSRFEKAIDQLAMTQEFKVKPKVADIFDAAFLPSAGNNRRTH